MKPAAQLLTLITMVLACIPARAADPANGKRLAERWCAACHAVSPDQRQASADAPAFSTIARQADFDPGALRCSCSIRTRKCPICR